MAARSASIFSRDIVDVGDPRRLPQARSAAADPKPGDVHRRDRQRHHDRHLPARSRPRRHRRAVVRRGDRRLALADRAVRELRGGDRREPRQGAGGDAARRAHDDARQPPHVVGRARAGAGPRPAARRRGRRRRRRGDPRRRRRDRGRRLGGRVRDHRRVRAGDPGGRRRPLGRHRRHPAALRPAGRRGHAGAGPVVSRPHDLAGRGRRAAQDAERDRPQHPAGGADVHLPRGGGHAGAVRQLRRLAAVADRADRPAGRADPDDHRRAALGDRHRRDGPPRAAQRAGHVRPRRRGVGRRRRAAAGQDRHDHAGQPPGVRVHARWTGSPSRSSPRPPSSRRCPTRRRRGARSSCSPRSATACASGSCPGSSTSSSRSRPPPG